MKNGRHTVSQIIAILKQSEDGTPVPELCREHGVSSATFYKWRTKYGGMDASMMKGMKELEDENRRRKEIAKHAVLARGIPVSMACRIFSGSETCYRYQPKHSSDNALIAD